jgi:hypothetical protein
MAAPILMGFQKMRSPFYQRDSKKQSPLYQSENFPSKKQAAPLSKGFFFLFKKVVALLLVGFQKSGLARFYHS